MINKKTSSSYYYKIVIPKNKLPEQYKDNTGHFTYVIEIIQFFLIAL